MQKIKGLADPNGIMNPGKIFSEEERQVPEETLYGEPFGIA
jgi:hypothetical protein